MRTSLRLSAVAVCAMLAWMAGAYAASTEFTYQGHLKDGGAPANGNYDLTFVLFDAASGGAQVGATVGKTGVAVSNGLFTVTLDFGLSPFTGADRYLEISVSAAGGAATVLTPRQKLTPTPYAMYAQVAGLSGPPSGPAAGGLTGSYPNPTIAAGAVGAANIDKGTAAGGQALTYDGANVIWGEPVAGGLKLPIAATDSGGVGPALTIAKTGSGGAAFRAEVSGASPGPAIMAVKDGAGPALDASTTGTAQAGVFQINNITNTLPAVDASTNGSGPALNSLTTGAGPAGNFQINSAGSPGIALVAATNGDGPALKVDASSVAAAPIATFHNGGPPVAAISKMGVGTFIGGAILGSSGAPITQHLSWTGSLNAGTPGAVPGTVDIVGVTVAGAALGDTVVVSCSIAWPSDFILTGFVTSANMVTIRWMQLAGAAVDPDSTGGATYRVDVWKH